MPTGASRQYGRVFMCYGSPGTEIQGGQISRGDLGVVQIRNLRDFPGDESHGCAECICRFIEARDGDIRSYDDKNIGLFESNTIKNYQKVEFRVFRDPGYFYNPAYFDRGYFVVILK